MPGQGTAPTPQTNCRGTADRINPLHTNPPDYTGAHRNTHVSTRPVVLFPAINTSEHRAGHVKQAHRKRWACFTLSYSPWSGSTGQGIKNPRAVFVVWGTQLGYNDGVHSVPHTCTPSLYSTGDVKICTASFRLNARTSRHMGGVLRLDAAPKPQRSKAATPSRVARDGVAGQAPHRNRHVGVPISRWGGNFRRLPPTRFNSLG